MFINAIGSVSPQKTFDNEQFLEAVVSQEGTSLYCIEPEYKTLINPRKLRRMSRLIRMGIYAAKVCLAEAKMEMPDAILVGTGLGCMEDTEGFLEEIHDSEEGLIAPTQFIQSTHNMVSSAIALMLKCYNYNFTYVHRGFSFESAILDALLTGKEFESANVLVGGIDELTEMYLEVTEKVGMWRKSSEQDADFLKLNQSANLPGEGAAFFMLGTERTAETYAEIVGLKMLYRVENEEVERGISAFLAEHNLTIEKIDVVCLGLNGSRKKDAVYHDLQETIFKNSNLTYFKHLCGEYKTATSFALWIAAQILKKQQIPTILKYQSFEISTIKNVLIYNKYAEANHSIFLLKNA